VRVCFKFPFRVSSGMPRAMETWLIAISVRGYESHRQGRATPGRPGSRRRQKQDAHPTRFLGRCPKQDAHPTRFLGRCPKQDYPAHPVSRAVPKTRRSAHPVSRAALIKKLIVQNRLRTKVSSFERSCEVSKPLRAASCGKVGNKTVSL